MRNAASGYCFINNVAVAAKHAIDNLNLSRCVAAKHAIDNLNFSRCVAGECFGVW